MTAALTVYGVVQSSERPRWVTVSSAPQAQVALVPGAGLTARGAPSLYLARRLEVARELYADGKVSAILVSGDNSRTTYDEPTAMRDWLVAQGVPDDVVVRDYAGFDTQDTCVRARKVFGVTSAIVVTQDYHLPRALFLCVHAGIDAHGVPASSANSHAVEYTLREGPASLKAAWDAATHRPPVYGGHETSVQQILTRAGR